MLSWCRGIYCDDVVNAQLATRCSRPRPQSDDNVRGGGWSEV